MEQHSQNTERQKPWQGRAGLWSIARNGSALMGSQLAEFGARAVYIIFLARFLGVEDYGVWAYGLALYGFAISLTGFGMDALVPLEVGKAGQSNTKIPTYLGQTLALRLVSTMVAALGLAAFLLFAETPAQAPLILLWLVPAMVGRAVALWVKTCFTAFEKAARLLRLSVPLALAEVVAGATLLFAGAGLAAVLALHAALWCLQACIGVRMVHTRLGALKPDFSLDALTLHIRRGWSLGLSTAISGWLMAAPLLLLGHIGTDPALLGTFSLPYNLAMLVYAALLPFLIAALPVLSRAGEREDPRVRHYGLWVLLGAGITMGSAGLIGLLAGEATFAFALGPTYASAGALVGPCLLLAGLLLAPLGYQQLLMLCVRTSPILIANITASGMIIAGFIWFVRPAEVATSLYVIAAAWATRALILIFAGQSHKKPGAKPRVPDSFLAL